MAVLKWNPVLSQEMCGALQRIDLPQWRRKCLMDDYLLFLNDLMHVVRQVPIALADIAACNIQMEALQGRLSELSSMSVIRSSINHSTERPRDLGFFNNADQVAIFGGNFTIITGRPGEYGTRTPDNEGPIPLEPPDRIGGNLEDGAQGSENGSPCPITRIIEFLKRFIRLG
ncbi:hypothetical protein CPC08DRAFT_767291 [Agrocybe pediades]|nr:hypothetical protein CPC08DRAFT_767291 [Agrocybe pediades]